MDAGLSESIRSLEGMMRKKGCNGKNLVRAAVMFAECCFLMIGVSGCMNRNLTVNKMVAYMNKKYDDHFEYSAPFGGGPGATSKQIIVTSEKYPEARVWVQYKEQNGQEEFADNYISYKYEEHTRSFLQKLLENAFNGTVTVLYSVPSKGSDNQFSNQTTFEEYLANSRIGFRAMVLLGSEPDLNSIENCLKESVKPTELTAFGSIYFTDSEQTFEKAFDQPQRSLELLNQLQFSMDEPGLISSLEWRPGNHE